MRNQTENDPYAAVASSEAALRDQIDLWPEVMAVAASLRETRENNGLDTVRGRIAALHHTRKNRG